MDFNFMAFTTGARPIKSVRIRLETISLCTQTERDASQLNAQNFHQKV